MSKHNHQVAIIKGVQYEGASSDPKKVFQKMEEEKVKPHPSDAKSEE